MYAYVYREVSDADLDDYVRFCASPLGQRYSEALAAALVGALTRASVRVGEKLPSLPDKNKV
jgi:hypothetical protein